MKKNIVRVLSLLLCAAMLIGCAACTQTINVRFVDKDGNDLNLGGAVNTNTTPAGETPASQAPASETPASETPASQAPTGETPASQAPASETPASQVPASETPASQAPASEAPASQAPAASTALPTDNAGILALYTELVNTFKASSPGYTKLEYQALPAEYRNFGGLANAIIGIAEGLVTSKDKATPEPHAQGDADVHNIPILNNAKGCLLTDASKIKSASCKDNGDGTATLVITLIDEDDPVPASKDATTCSSYTGAVFMPMSKSGIDETVAKFSAVAKVNSLVLTYTDCTVTAVFKIADKKLTSLTYVMPVEIKANAKVVLSTIDGSARLIDTMEITGISY
ncbi:MAG: hypothetical protein IJT27_08780 [Clostridia bacterium]|nr:hypothetical protein [Clostridia bacterium]